MARKRPTLDSPFRRTEAKRADSLPAEGRTLAVGVGLKESEIQILDDVASQLGVSRNQVLRYAVRQFLKDYLSGMVQPEVTQELKRNLSMP